MENAFMVGEKVLAEHEDGYHYPAIIQRATNLGYLVFYEEFCESNNLPVADIKKLVNICNGERKENITNAHGNVNDKKKNHDFSPIVHEYKVIVLGDSAVGKSVFLNQLHKVQSPYGSRTTEMDYITKSSIMADGTKVIAKIYKLPGKEKFRSHTAQMIRGSLGALLMYNVDNRKSFKQIMYWINEFRKYAKGNVLVLVQNEINIMEKMPQESISYDEIKRLVMEQKLFWIQVSTKTGYNVEQAFEKLILTIYEKQKREQTYVIPELSNINIITEEDSRCY